MKRKYNRMIKLGTGQQGRTERQLWAAHRYHHTQGSSRFCGHFLRNS